VIPPHRLPTGEPPTVPVSFGFAALSTLLATLLYVVVPPLFFEISGRG
jgi:hypothetical protein